MRSICVFAGSSFGATPEFKQAAAAFGSAIAVRGLRLVYGGASVVLMGAVADAALKAGGAVTGVLPKSLADRETGWNDPTTLA